MGIPLRVLVIEDSEDDALLALRELSKSGYEPTSRRVETVEQFASALEEEGWDLIIADYALPRFSAPDALSLLEGKNMDIPFIIVSGKVGEEAAVAMMRAGARDYIMKGNLARLPAAVERELRESRVRWEKKLAEEALLRAHEELEARVSEKIAELSKLRKELRQLKRHQ